MSPTSRYRAGNGPIFSASKVPPGPGLANSCELPFGCLWTPLSPPTDDSDWAVHQCNGAALPPVTCLTCCTYLNIYAELDEAENTWICPLCQGKNVTTSSILQSAITKVPGMEFRQTIVDTDEKDTLTVVLVVDQNLSPTEAHAIGMAVQESIANPDSLAKMTVQLGLVTFGKLLNVYQLANASLGIVSADVFSKHGQITDTHLGRRRYLAQLHDDDAIDCLWKALAAAYGISPDYRGSKDEHTQQPTLSRLERLKRNKEERIRKELGETSQANLPRSPWTFHSTEKTLPHRGIRNVGEAIQAAIDLAAVGSESPARTARILLFTNGCPNFGEGSVVISDGLDATTGLILAMETAPPKRVPKMDIVDPIKLTAAIEYFSDVGKASSELGVAMDVFCSGSSELALSSYQALVEPSSGYVLPQLMLEEDALTRNLRYILCETFVPGLHFNGADSSCSPVVDKHWIDGCILDIRVPSFLTMTHVVGPGELIEDSKRMLVNERSSFGVGASLAAAKSIKTSNLPMYDLVEATSLRIHLGRFDPMSTFSFMLQVNEFYQHESHALFQCIARFVDRHGKVLVTKVFTRRLAVAGEVAAFLDGVDDEVVPVLLGKEAVYRAIFGREASSSNPVGVLDPITQESLACDAQHDIDATIQRISVAYRLLGLQHGTARRGVDLTEEGGIRAAGSSIDFAFPPELSDALRRLYHLRRGPLVSPGPMQSLDDRAHLRSLFLRLPLEECLCMMALSVWSSGTLTSEATATHVGSVPPDTLALWNDVVLVADHFYELFIWSGKLTQTSEFDAVREHFRSFVIERSKDRFPVPTLHVLKEDESMCRRFIALLAPSHADPVEHQLAHFPSLAKLSPDKLSLLQRKVKFYDTATDLSFRNWFWTRSSASNQSKEDGISLCD